MYRMFWLLAFYLIGINSCQKDHLTLPEADPSQPRIPKGYGPISVQEARQLFSGVTQDVQSRNYNHTIEDITPLWDAAEASLYADTADILLVPVAPDTNRLPGAGANLVFFRDIDSVLTYRMLVHIPHPDYWDSTGYRLNVQTFTGAIVVVEPDGSVGEGYFFHQGNFVGTDNGAIAAALEDSNTGVDDRDDDPRCPKWNGSFWDHIGDFFNNIWDGFMSIFNSMDSSGGGSGAIHEPVILIPGNYSNTNNTSGGNGGGGGETTANNLSGYFNQNLFTGIERENAILVNNIKADLCLEQSSAALLDSIKMNCGLVEASQEELFFYLQMFEQDVDSAPECMKELVVENLFEVSNDVRYMLVNSKELLSQMTRFLADKQCNERAKDYLSFVANQLHENPNYKWERFEELYELVENNPDALIQNCTTPDPVYGNWEALASFVPSGAALQRIQNSNGTWNVQSILDASGARVNLDFFAVVIDDLPVVNGQRLTAKQLFDHFRKNINDFAPTFNPYDDPYDKDLWDSDNPLGAIMHIIINPLVDGDVITSQSEECCWIFTTLRGPFYYAGYHPVSGNRMFGYATQNGQTIIYTRGADRTTTWYHGINNSEPAFVSADAFWHGMQANLSKYVTDNGGQLSTTPTYEIIHRPNWNNVKDVLLSNYPVTSISCN